MVSWSVPLISVIRLRYHMAENWSGENKPKKTKSWIEKITCRRWDLNRRPLERQAMMVTTIPRRSPLKAHYRNNCLTPIQYLLGLWCYLYSYHHSRVPNSNTMSQRLEKKEKFSSSPGIWTQVRSKFLIFSKRSNHLSYSHWLIWMIISLFLCCKPFTLKYKT